MRTLLFLLALLVSQSAHAVTNTTNYGFNKPAVNDPVDQDLWGDQLNDNWDLLDTLLNTVTSAKSASFNVGADEFDYFYLIDSSGGNVTATLPAASSVYNGFRVHFKAVDLSNDVTLDGNGSETIDGETTYSISAVDDSITLICDGSNWQILSTNAEVAASSETVSGIVEKATSAEAAAQTSDKNLTADNAQYLPFAPVFVISFDGSGSGSLTPLYSYNVSDVTKNATGTYTVTLTNALDDTDVAMFGFSRLGPKDATTYNGSGNRADVYIVDTSTIVIKTGGSSALADHQFVNAMGYGTR